MDALIEFLSMYRTAVIIAVIIIATGIFFIIKKDQLGLYWLRFTYGFPFLGKSKRLSKDFQMKQLGKESWFLSEDILCSDFQQVYDDKNEGLSRTAEEYETSKAYLAYAGESARKLNPWWVWPVLTIVFVIEAAGFGYVFASYASPDASENTQLIMAYGFAALLSGVAVFLTKKAGFEIYENSVRKNIRNKQNSGFDLRVTTQNIKLDETNESDSDQPIAIRMLNRVEPTIGSDVTSKRLWTISTLIAVLLLAALALGVRYMTLERSLSEDQQMMTLESGSGAYETVDPYGNDVAVPEGFLTETQETAEDNTINDILAAEKAGSIMTYVAFAIVYLLLQIVGTAAGYNAGFVGVESKKAFKIVNKFLRAEQYVRFYDQERRAFEAIAQNHLNSLQKMLGQRARSHSLEQIERSATENFANRNYPRFVLLTHEIELSNKRSKHLNQTAHDTSMASVEAQNYVPTTNNTVSSSISDEPIQSVESESLEERMARIKANALAKQEEANDEQARLAGMSDEELEKYMREKGDLA